MGFVTCLVVSCCKEFMLCQFALNVLPAEQPAANLSPTALVLPLFEVVDSCDSNMRSRQIVFQACLCCGLEV
jgi:hypothetical protein